MAHSLEALHSTGYHIVHKNKARSSTMCSRRRARHTFGEILDADIVKLLNFLHDQLFLVDLYDHRSVSSVATGEAELAKSGLELLGNVYRAGLMGRIRGLAEHDIENKFRTGGKVWMAWRQTIVWA